MIEPGDKNTETTQPTPPAAAVADGRKRPMTLASRPLIDPTINPTTLPSEDDDKEINKHRKKTGGEKLFDRVVYTGIGFGVNEGAALVIADQFEHGVGKKTFGKITDWMVKSLKFGEKVAKDGARVTPHQNAANALVTFVLLLDGTALVAPMKWLENRKAHWVKKANHFLDKRHGNPLSEAEVAARDKEVDKAIACEPNQSWSSLLIGRALAVASSMSTSMYLMGPARMTKAGNFTENLLTRGKFSTQPNPNVAPGQKKSAGQRYAFLTGIETICCAVTSVVLEITSKFFAKKNQKLHDSDLCNAPGECDPKTDTNADDKNEKNKASLVAPKSLDTYKSKKILPMENHTDLAKQSEAGLSLS